MQLSERSGSCYHLSRFNGPEVIVMPVRGMDQERQERVHPFTARLKHTLAAASCLCLLTGLPNPTGAADCPPPTQERIPWDAPQPNMDIMKEVLLTYKSTHYDGDVAAVFTTARAYVVGRVGQVSKPALVLDIDETSLSNWPNLKANNFGFIRDGPCDWLPEGPCGFVAWLRKGVSPVIMPALDLFNAAKTQAVAVFFISGRRDIERQATRWNLERAGYERWTRLITRPNDDIHATVQAFKTEERRKIAEEGYTIIANVGDQQSDLDGGFAECTFKVPNPFYFIPLGASLGLCRTSIPCVAARYSRHGG
jgi:HAD superfamily, subfamily IIIB (Acid phosphatase)